MKLLLLPRVAAALALWSTPTFLGAVVVATAEEDCPGGVYDKDTTTKLDTMGSNVTTNTLHVPGGELRYEDIGIVRDRPVSLVVTISDGDYTDIEQVWIDNGKDKNKMNGKTLGDQFAKINLQTVKKKPRSGEGNFRMCFVDKETNEPTKIEEFTWVVFDLDERGKDTPGKPVIKEKLIMDAAQAQRFELWPNQSDSEIKLSCEGGSQVLPCSQGVRTIFHSSAFGGSSDNPRDKNAVTDLQKSRSVTFTFANTDCWEFTYDHYCPVEQDGYDGPSKKKYCNKYTGGFFQFSADAEEVTNKGECLNLTSSATGSPSASPSVSPPTTSPSKTTTSLTGSPTAEPSTASPTSKASGAPTTNPTGEDQALSLCPQDITLIKQKGLTDFPINEAITFVKQDTSTVTVELNQAWTSTSSVDSIFYSFRRDKFSEVCYEAQNVGNNAVYDTIEIQCEVLSPHATLEICVADDASHGVLVPGKDNDDATIPKCCHADAAATPTTAPVVCYVVEIACATLCGSAQVAIEEV
uniref:DUF7633 domain-containing protein n=1 Tax=Pseudo-nitzschia australis TaxID=44445 RepID=A0A6V0CXB9_9STRA